MRRRRTIVVAALLAVFIASFGISAAIRSANGNGGPPAAATNPTAPTSPTFSAEPSIDDPSSEWVVVNKHRPLSPVTYAPADLVPVAVDQVNPAQLRAVAADAVVQMFAAFHAETGLNMQSQSAYRSYASQEDVYAGWVEQLGQAGADLTSARPGFSEHQTGLAIDVAALPAECSLDQCFADTAQGRWLDENSWRFGFVIRYPEGMTSVTGYEYEPWHLRYVGIELATRMHESGTATLEQFFTLEPATDYLP